MVLRTVPKPRDPITISLGLCSLAFSTIQQPVLFSKEHAYSAPTWKTAQWTYYMLKTELLRQSYALYKINYIIGTSCVHGEKCDTYQESS